MYTRMRYVRTLMCYMQRRRLIVARKVTCKFCGLCMATGSC